MKPAEAPIKAQPRPKKVRIIPFGIPPTVRHQLPPPLPLRERVRPDYQPKGRHRRRGRSSKLYYVHSFAGNSNSSAEDSSSPPAMVPSIGPINPVVEQILHELKYSPKETYRVRDIIWVQSDTKEWILAIIKYALHNGHFIGRPLSESADAEFKIRPDQIFPSPPALSLRSLQRSVMQLKDELSNVYSGKKKEIFQGTLVRYNNDVFAEVMERHEDNSYTIKVRDECKSYIGPVIISNVKHNAIQLANETELKHHIYGNKPNEKRKESNNSAPKRNWHSDNQNELLLYDFLEEMGDIYIDTFLFNGITNIKIALCLNQDDLKEMKIKLGHRRYIIQLIQNYTNKQEKKSSHDEEKEKQRSYMNPGYVAPPVKKDSQLIIYDFNRTLTCIDFYYEVQPETYDGDVEHMFKNVSDERFEQIFGGKERIRRLHEHFKCLSQENVQLAIVSFAYTSVIKAALKRIQLYDYFADSPIVGGDSVQMQMYHGNKALYILNTFTDSDYKQWNATDILLVDDDPAVISQVTNLKVCKSLLINPRSGITEDHMLIIENMIEKQKNSDADSDENAELEGVSYAHSR